MWPGRPINWRPRSGLAELNLTESGQISVVADLAAVDHPLELDSEDSQTQPNSACGCDQAAARRDLASRPITPDNPAGFDVYSI